MKTQVIPLRVRYGETDAMGVVYYANYLTWFEVARTEYCRNLGYPYSKWEEDGVFLPAVEAWCRYKHPARYDDEIEIEITLKELKITGLTFLYKVYRKSDKRLLALGETKHAFCNRDGRLLKKPEPVWSWLCSLFGKID